METIGNNSTGIFAEMGRLLFFILAFGFLAFVHELGHFLFSRLFKIEVEEFGLGLPPRWVKLFTWKGTDFTLNWIPFGAFVRPKGENDPEVPGGLASAKPGARFLVFLGGPLMNFLAALLIFFAVTAYDGIDDPNSLRYSITQVLPDSPASQAGFQPGDIFVKIGNQDISPNTEVSQVVRSYAGQQVTFIMERQGQLVTLTATPRAQTPSLGIYYQGMYYARIPVTIPESLRIAAVETVNKSRAILLLPVELITGRIPLNLARLVSVVGVYQTFDQVAELQQEGLVANPQGAPRTQTVYFFGIISIALAVFNLLPLPALDGGRILFLVPEAIFHRRVPQRFENAVHAVGLVLMLALMFILVINDLINPVQLR